MSKDIVNLDGYRKSLGIIGEGIAADRIIKNLGPLYNSIGVVAIGINQNGFHHDILKTTPLGNTTFGTFELNVQSTDENGNTINNMVDVPNINFYGHTSFEVKTFNPKTEPASLLAGFKTGVDQIIDRANTTDAGVLIFDKDAFLKIKNYNPTALNAQLQRINSVLNQQGQRKVFLKLEKSLYLESQRAFFAITSHIKDLD